MARTRSQWMVSTPLSTARMQCQQCVRCFQKSRHIVDPCTSYLPPEKAFQKLWSGILKHAQQSWRGWARGNNFIAFNVCALQPQGKLKLLWGSLAHVSLLTMSFTFQNHVSHYLAKIGNKNRNNPSLRKNYYLKKKEINK